MYLKTLEAQRQVLGDEHLHSLRTMNGLATLYTGQGRYDEAETLLIEAVDIGRRKLREKHSKTLQFLNALIELYEAWNLKKLKNGDQYCLLNDPGKAVSRQQQKIFFFLQSLQL